MGKAKSSGDMREPFGGRYFGIWNVEGSDGEPIALFPSEQAADEDLARRQALPLDHDDHADEYHHVFPCDVRGAWWNSYEPCPRTPLSFTEIMAAHGVTG